MNARVAHDAPSSAEVEVALFSIEHPSLAAPIRLSTDPTTKVSPRPDGTGLSTPHVDIPDDELAYGTPSTWDGANPDSDPYLFVLASAELPDDLEDAPAQATIVLENVSNDVATLLRSFTDPAVAHLAVVLASSPNLPEMEYRDLRIVSSGGDAGEVTLQLSRRPIEEESVPMDRFTKHRFPGLFR